MRPAGIWRAGLAASVLGVMVAIPGVSFAAADETPTYAKDVAPIFREKCESCHRPGYIAPMSLQTYAESRPWARSIKNRVETRQMPPWHLDKSVGIQDFQNDRSLSDNEISTIVRWADGGAPPGNPADAPPAAVFADDDVWNYAERFGGPPDMIVRSTPTRCRRWRRTIGGSRRCRPGLLKIAGFEPSRSGRRRRKGVVSPITRLPDCSRKRTKDRI